MNDSDKDNYQFRVFKSGSVIEGRYHYYKTFEHAKLAAMTAAEFLDVDKFIAFNNSIVKELQTKLPTRVPGFQKR